MRASSVKKTVQKHTTEKSIVKSTPHYIGKNNSLTRYMADVSKYRLLTREEEIELARRVQDENDMDAAYQLVTSNLRLVIKIALQFYQIWSQNILDLIQEGNIGLMQAVRKYDPHRNTKFSYYASFWIKAKIIKYIMENFSLVKIGTTLAQRKLFNRLKKEQQNLIKQGFDPDHKLLAENLGVSEKEVVSMSKRLSGTDSSLDSTLIEGSNTKRVDMLKVEAESIDDQVGKKELTKILEEKLKVVRESLNPRERDLLESRIIADDPISLQEFGNRYGISRERARQVERKIINKTIELFRRDLPDFELYAA